MTRTEPNSTRPVNGLELREAEAFLYHEVKLLDERRLEEWLALFTEDGYYWVPARPGQKDQLDEVSLFFDDREFMATRIRRLRHPNIHIETPPSRSFHLLGNIRLEDDPPEGADALVSSGMIMLEYRAKRGQRMFGGRCRHALRRDGKDLKIFWKKVELINCDDTFGPLTLFF
jgi:3-phenylpropionate/cinnamic acid dioxygenase small subunit